MLPKQERPRCRDESRYIHEVKASLAESGGYTATATLRRPNQDVQGVAASKDGAAKACTLATEAACVNAGLGADCVARGEYVSRETQVR
jgi:hypothetical protein